MKTKDAIIKEEYVEILRSGMFFEFFPDMKGTWEKDEKEFKKFYYNREDLKNENK